MKKITCIHEVLDSRLPDTEDRYVGIEIEFASPLNEKAVQKIIYNHKSIRDYLSLDGDGSIDGNECRACDGSGYTDNKYFEECSCGCGARMTDQEDTCKQCNGEGVDTGHELKVLVPEQELTKVVPKVLKMIREKMKGYVNDTCGLHIHLDMRNRVVTQAYNNLQSVQEVLFKMNPIQRITSSYCQFNGRKDFHAALSEGVKYDAINARAYENYKTIEVRISAATLKAERMLPWIQLLIRCADAKMIKEDIGTLRDLSKYVGLEPQLRKFVKARINACRSTHNGYQTLASARDNAAEWGAA